MKCILVLIAIIVPAYVSGQMLVSVNEIPADSTWDQRIIYQWRADGLTGSLHVMFYKVKMGGYWGVEVPADEFVRSEIKKKGVDSTTLAEILDQSWLDFSEKKPGATIRHISVDMSICRDIWSGIEDYLRLEMPGLKGLAEPKSRQLLELFEAALLETSAMVDFIRVADKHRMKIEFMVPAEFLMPEESLWGRPWREVSLAPYAGLQRPVWGILALK